jgi:hypothetical protein
MAKGNALFSYFRNKAIKLFGLNRNIVIGYFYGIISYARGRTEGREHCDQDNNR